MKSNKPVSYIIVGAGNRGQGYAGFAAEFPERAQVLGVAEPRAFQRERLVDQHHPEHVFLDWREAALQPRLADAVIISTQDSMHADPAVAFAEKGYHILLEKPMAVTEADCTRIVDAVKKNEVHFAVGHVLRYTRYFSRLKQLILDGAVGEVVNIQHTEPVGFWHQAHSFVRGNWRNTECSSPMLMAKSCHDLDLIRWLMDVACERVSSFGSLIHFRPENRPEGASDRCLDCAVEVDCPYSAKRLYLDFQQRGKHGWPLEVVTDEFSEEKVIRALREGPYGRCVYACDNDVVDHQVVNFAFAGGRTASFTMTAFSNAQAHRTTRVFGTKGELIGDGHTITTHRFLDGEKTVINPRAADPGILGGHGGGDFGLMDAFTRAISENDGSHIRSGPDEALESHRMVFAAERARLEGVVVHL
jgi:predicted dehydrogenase